MVHPGVSIGFSCFIPPPITWTVYTSGNKLLKKTLLNYFFVKNITRANQGSYHCGVDTDIGDGIFDFVKMATVILLVRGM